MVDQGSGTAMGVETTRPAGARAVRRLGCARRGVATIATKLLRPAFIVVVAARGGLRRRRRLDRATPIELSGMLGIVTEYQANGSVLRSNGCIHDGFYRDLGVPLRRASVQLGLGLGLGLNLRLSPAAEIGLDLQLAGVAAVRSIARVLSDEAGIDRQIATGQHRGTSQHVQKGSQLRGFTHNAPPATRVRPEETTPSHL
jgi:hypothetical protein